MVATAAFFDVDNEIPADGGNHRHFGSGNKTEVFQVLSYFGLSADFANGISFSGNGHGKGHFPIPPL